MTIKYKSGKHIIIVPLWFSIHTVHYSRKKTQRLSAPHRRLTLDRTVSPDLQTCSPTVPAYYIKDSKWLVQAASLTGQQSAPTPPPSLFFNYIVSPVPCKQGELINPRSAHDLTCCITFPARCVKTALPTAHPHIHTHTHPFWTTYPSSGTHIYQDTDTLNPSLIPLSGSVPVPSC